LIVFIDRLASNKEFYRSESTLCNPARISPRIVRCELTGRRLKYDPHVTDEISSTSQCYRDESSRVRLASKSLRNCLDREIGMTLVYRLKKSDRGFSSQIDILSPISDELKQSSSRHFNITCDFN
jgi:hypothetical protein